MKPIYKYLIILGLIIGLLYAAGLKAQVQEDPTEQVQEFDFKIDPLGDATLDVSTKMTQAQWENFKAGPLVNDPSISKRDMERSLSTYVIEDFKRDIDDMNRSVKISLKLRAFAQYNGNGKWELKLDAKNPQVTKLADNAYMITSNKYFGGALTEQIFKVYFPDGASNVQQATDSFDKTIFNYNTGGGFLSYFPWTTVVGILLIAAAVVVFIVGNKGKSIIGPQKQIANP